MPAPAISQGLTALLPSYPASNKPFPPALISQCESLLALSRQRASHLKVEEEIARAHACCEIACKGLRAQLRLPAIKSGAGAPCKPKVYTKLIGFLEGILTDARNEPSTPRGKKRDANGTVKESGGSARTVLESGKHRSAKGDETPSKKRTADRTTTTGTTFTGKVKNNRNQGQAQDINGNKAPSFVMPTIRKLCKHFSTTQMTPHIYTGTCIILELAKIWPPDDNSSNNNNNNNEEEEVQETTLNLIIALYLMIHTKMRTGRMIKSKYTEISTQSFELLGLDETRDREKMEDWINRLNKEGWCIGQDWWDSVPEDILDSNDEHGGDDGDMTNEQEEQDGEISGLRRREGVLMDKNKLDLDLEKDDPDGVLLPGLGTMLHYGVDWTSDDRKAEFDEWKKGLLRRLALLEKGRTGNSNGNGSTGNNKRKGKAVAVA